MPLISLSQEVIDRGKVPEIGWSHGKLNDVTEFKSSAGNSMNYLFEFVLDQGPEKRDDNKGRYINAFFNSKALGADGSKGIADVINQFLLMIAALQGISRSEVTPDDYDTDKLKNKECWMKIEAVTDQNGKLATAITDFSSSIEIPF